jgi:hypothetical protein
MICYGAIEKSMSETIIYIASYPALEGIVVRSSSREIRDLWIIMLMKYFYLTG